MLESVQPLPYRIEALPRPGQFAISVLVDGQDRTMVTEVVDGEVVVPQASRVDGWSTDAESYQATMASVLALHRARESGRSGPQLLDVDGGWDVSLGNVVLSPDGHPTCVAHGGMELDSEDSYVCTECSARARYGALG